MLREFAMGVLMGDFSALLEISVYFILLFFLINQHPETKTILLAWAIIYLIGLTGIKAGAKTLVIMGGNAWEINPLRYRIDVFLVVLGLLILIFRNVIFIKK